MNQHELYMQKALHYAFLCGERGEVPVGAVIVRNGEIVAWGSNSRETKKNALGHAEITAIDRACRALHGWRLWECDMYVTLEPCSMCAGAIVNARIRNLYIGAHDEKAGAFGGKFDINSLGLCHRPTVHFGLCESEARKLLTDFFKKLRHKSAEK